MLALLAPLACQNTDEPDPPSDEALLLISLERWRSALDAGFGHNALAYVAQDFLDQGSDRDAYARWIDQLAAAGSLRVDLDDLRLAVDGDTATVDYLLSIAACSAASDEGPAHCDPILRCRSAHQAACGWVHRWARTPEGWRVVGDRQTWGKQLHLRFDAGGLRVVGALYDPARVIDRATAIWPDGSSFELVRAGLQWSAPADADVPSFYYPEHPLPWVLELDLELDTGAATDSVRFQTFMDRFARDLQPTGSTVAPIQFAWTLQDSEGGTELRLSLDGDVLWRSARTFAPRLDYSGPDLEPGRVYLAEAHTYDLYGNVAVASSDFLLLDATDVAPTPRSLSPSSGPATGGVDLTIVGDNMLEGVRVELGSEACVGVLRVDDAHVQCTTPPLQPGTYHLAVINPSGAVGLLEDAFIAL